MLLFSFKHVSASQVEQDKERLIRVEVKLDALEDKVDALSKDVDQRFMQIDKRFDDIDKRFNDLQNYMLGGFGVLFTMMIALVGFILWDRRSVTAPLEREARTLKQREELLEQILIQYGKQEPKLLEILKTSGLI